MVRGHLIEKAGFEAPHVSVLFPFSCCEKIQKSVWCVCVVRRTLLFSLVVLLLLLLLPPPPWAVQLRYLGFVTRAFPY
jgi:hypothetical protein